MAFGRRREFLLSSMWRQVSSEEAAAIVAAMDEGAAQAAKALVAEAGMHGKEDLPWWNPRIQHHMINDPNSFCI